MFIEHLLSNFDVYFQVDFGSALNVVSVTISNRAENLGEFLVHLENLGHHGYCFKTIVCNFLVVVITIIGHSSVSLCELFSLKFTCIN